MVIIKDGKEIKIECKICPVCGADLTTWKEMLHEEHRCWERKPEVVRC
jgi:D-arabinose 1-dehydrogenase-like Zn-dependent alcohol dehydrogenase